jgi:hypothetical protein
MSLPDDLVVVRSCDRAKYLNGKNDCSRSIDVLIRALALKGLGPRHLGVTCTSRASPCVFGSPTISSSMTVKPIPASG